MKCSRCGSEMKHRGAFETVDDVRYKSYVCQKKGCLNVKLGGRLDEDDEIFK